MGFFKHLAHNSLHFSAYVRLSFPGNECFPVIYQQSELDRTLAMPFPNNSTGSLSFVTSCHENIG